MTDVKTDTSLNALMVYAAVTLLCIGAAWAYFEYRDTTSSTAPPPVVLTPTPISTDEIAPIMNQRIGTSLNKARLAAEANMLVNPAGENALYFYGLVLNEDRTHTEANEEVDALLSQLHTRVQDYLSAAEFLAAHRIAEQVAYLRPEHALVSDTRLALQQRQSELLSDALDLATLGERENALQQFSSAAALPGADTDAQSEARTEVDVRLAKFDASEALRLKAEQQARADAAKALEVPEWLVDARAALAKDQLIEPAGDNAREYLAQGDGDKADLFRADLVSALLEHSEQAATAGSIDDATIWLEAAAELDPDNAQLDRVAVSVKDARVQALAAEPISPSELKRRNRVAPLYPRHAERRGTSGWVDMAFTVTTTGTTTDLEVLRSEPEDVFESAAIQAASQWLFEPREIEGILVNQRVMTRFSFQLDDD